MRKIFLAEKRNTQGVFQIFSLLWSQLGSRRRIQFGALFLTMVLTSFAEVASIGAVIPFLGALTTPELVFEHKLALPLIRYLEVNEPDQLFLPLTIIFVIVALIAGLMRIVLLWAQTRYSHSIGADFSVQIYRLTLFQPYLTHLNRNSSELISGITTKVNTVAFQVILPLLNMISSFLILIAILTVLFFINPLAAFLSFFGFGFIYVSIMLLAKKRLAIDSRRISAEQIQVVKSLQEGLGGIRDVLLDGTQETFINNYKKSELPLRRAIANVHIISGSPRFGIEALGMAFIACIALFLSINNSQPDFVAAIPVLGALALGAQRLLPVLQLIYSSWTAFLGNERSLDDVLDLLTQPMPEYLTNPDKKLLKFKQDIKLNQIKFRYRENANLVLDGITLTIPKKSRLGIIGSTGCGKSTLLDIIMGLTNPTSGQILIDDTALTDSNRSGWQLHIAHVPQNIFRADCSIAENIAFGVKPDDIDLDRLHQVANLAKITDLVESFDEKFETLVGERGFRLSGGQRQRIGIARALYKKADVIVLDEATSALDNKTEKSIMETIESISEDITFIIVAHRITTLQNCTQIIELSDGKVKRNGDYNEIGNSKRQF